MKRKTLKSLFSVIISVIVVCCLFIFLYLKNKNSIIQSNLIKEADSIVNENIIKISLPNYLKKLSIYISNKTLGIFVLNPLFIFLLKPFYSFIQVENFLIDSIMIFLFSILIFILCILTIEILSRTFIKKLISN